MGYDGQGDKKKPTHDQMYGLLQAYALKELVCGASRDSVVSREQMLGEASVHCFAYKNPYITKS